MGSSKEYSSLRRAVQSCTGDVGTGCCGVMGVTLAVVSGG